MGETLNSLVIGGCGFIGSHLVSYLNARGDEVSVFDNLSSGNLKNVEFIDKKIEFTKGDVTKKNQVRDCILKNHPHRVFNLAATNLLRSLEDPTKDLLVSGLGSLNVLDVVRRSKLVDRIVYASSGSVYGEARYSPQDENHPLEPTSPSGAAKLLGERYHQVWRVLHGTSFSILRLYNVYGPHQDYSRQGGVVPIFINRMLNGKPPIIEGSGKQLRCFTYVEDVVRAFALAAEHPLANGLAFNVATKESCTIIDLADKLNQIMGTSYTPEFTLPRPGDILDFRPAINLAEKRLGYVPRILLNDGLSRTVEWLKSISYSKQ